MRTVRLERIPSSMRREMIAARQRKHWSQAELGKLIGLPQMHISRIETGKIVPRFDTLLDVVRVLDYDLLLVPRPLVPMVQSLVRDQSGTDQEERPLYATQDPQENADEY